MVIGMGCLAGSGSDSPAAWREGVPRGVAFRWPPGRRDPDAGRTEQEALRLKLELERLALDDPAPADRRGPLPEVRRGDALIYVGRLRRKGPCDKH